MENQSAVAVKASVSAPFSVPIVSTAGKTTGHRFMMAQGKSAREIKAGCLAANPALKGNKLNMAVRAVLTGEKEAREQFGVLFLQYAYQSGFAADLGELRKNTGTLKLVRVGATVAPKDYVSALTEAEKIELRKILGV